jgi:hypothetical protein
MIEFISYEEYPDDQYIKEIATIQIDGKYRVAYVAKMTKNGAKFWDVMSTGVSQKGEKIYIKAFAFDSNFQQEEIKKLLASRPWENKSVFAPSAQVAYQDPFNNTRPAQAHQQYQQPDLFDAVECPF